MVMPPDPRESPGAGPGLAQEVDHDEDLNAEVTPPSTKWVPAPHVPRAAFHVTKLAAVEKLTKGEREILSVLLAKLCAWSQYADTISSTQLATLAGWGGSYESRSARVRAALKSLAAKRLIVYIPGNTNTLPTVGIDSHPPRDGVCDETPICPGVRPHPEFGAPPSGNGSDPIRWGMGTEVITGVSTEVSTNRVACEICADVDWDSSPVGSYCTDCGMNNPGPDLTYDEWSWGYSGNDIDPVVAKRVREMFGTQAAVSG